MQQKSRGVVDNSIVQDRISQPKRKSRRAVTVVNSITPDHNALPKSGSSAGEWSDRSRTPSYHHGGE